ncbi:hydrogenase maturation protease [Parasulfuritortus cantonensis]|uniref:Hydrogenase maturation protease n=1 Tax=Parasulfuritortus cantonensis TaxID=2528202 RepID=A0A4R1B8Z8_9PROT|nr:hydrogenase maturation protease [Parasulfuritortus cantonensis]TCJ12963.1 hydrogenase maturation protease [Parasulfuritortus cantonensis]
MSAATLIVGIGNPSRGDDALGPLAIERLEAMAMADVELLTDFQLQVEYALDLQDRRRVVFVDAAESGPEPYAWAEVRPEQDTSYSSHELSPAAVLHTYAQLYGTPPVAHVLAVRGYRYDLGAPPSPAALANLDQAIRRLLAELA